MTEKTRRRLHKGLATFFAIQIPVAIATDLKNSTPYLVVLSLWALVASHWAAAEADTPGEEE